MAHLDPTAKARREQMKVEDDLLRSPGPDVLQIAAMEHAPMWADILWLQIVQELGKPIDGELASFDRVQRWSNIAVDLDQKYYTVYYAAGVHLIVYAKRVRAAEKLLTKGMSFLPDRWEFPFLIGYAYYFHVGDPGMASKWWEKAMSLPDAPRFFPSLMARAMARAAARDSKNLEDAINAGVESLELILPTLDGPQKLDAEIRIKLFKSEKVLAEYDEG